MYVVEQAFFFVFHYLKQHVPSPCLTQVQVHGWTLERLLGWLYKDYPGQATVLELRSVLSWCGQSLSQSNDIVPTSRLPLPRPPGGPLVPTLPTHKFALQLPAGIRQARGNVRPENYLGEHLDAPPHFTVKRWSPRQKNPLTPGQDRGIDGPSVELDGRREKSTINGRLLSIRPWAGCGHVFYLL